jgi:hypothetical protein
MEDHQIQCVCSNRSFTRECEISHKPQVLQSIICSYLSRTAAWKPGLPLGTLFNAILCGYRFCNRAKDTYARLHVSQKSWLDQVRAWMLSTYMQNYGKEVAELVSGLVMQGGQGEVKHWAFNDRSSGWSLQRYPPPIRISQTPDTRGRYYIHYIDSDARTIWRWSGAECPTARALLWGFTKLEI